MQGAADMGCQPHQGAGYFETTDMRARTNCTKFYGVKLSKETGWKIPQMFDAALEGKLKALWLMGEDIVQTDPNSEHVRQAMNALEFLVVQEIFMTETAKYANVILPASTFLEKSGTFTNAERRVQRVRKVTTPRNGLADWEVTIRLARAMGYEMNYSASQRDHGRDRRA